MLCNTDRNLNAISVSSGRLVGAWRNNFWRGICSCSACPAFALLILLLVASLSAGCSSNILGQSFSASAAEDGQQSADAGLRTVISLRKQSQTGSASNVAELRHAEEEAAAHYLVAGTEARIAGHLDEAARLFELGLLAQPGNLALNEARAATLKRKDVLRFSAEAERARIAGNTEAAQSLYQKAEFLDRGNAKVLAALREMSQEEERRGEKFAIKAFESRTPIELNFRDARLKDALLVIAKPYNLNFVFDATVADVEISVSAKRLTFFQAMQLLLQSGDCFYKAIGQNSILVSKNQKKQKYTDLYFKTFYLQTVKAEKMAEILSSSMQLKTVIPDKTLNAVQIRASREALKIAERVIAEHDRTRAQIALDIEILEVDRTKSRQLGIDHGSQIAAQFPQANLAAAIEGPAKVLSSGAVTLPVTTLNYLKNDVNTKTLSKPRIRTVDGEAAKIHVGDKVPLRSASFQDGQNRTAFEYHDIGLKIDALPRYSEGGSISVELKLEVSSLGHNLGTAAEPAYSVGTRNISTHLILRDGEAAILAGFVQDEDRQALSQVPGASDLEGAGRLFAVDGYTGSHTDILMTVTSYVVGQRGLPSATDSDFYSGSLGDFTSEDASGYLKQSSASGEPLRYRLSAKGAQQVADDGPTAPSAGASAPQLQAAAAAAPPGKRPQLIFVNELYSVDQGDRVVVEVRGRDLGSAKLFTTSVLFNPAKLSLEEYEDCQTGKRIKAEGDPTGVFKLTVTPPKSSGADVLIAKLTLQGRERGLSYLLLNNSDAVLDQAGNAVLMELGSSKVEVR
jgi:general secretion pathway protein D